MTPSEENETDQSCVSKTGSKSPNFNIGKQQNSEDDDSLAPESMSFTFVTVSPA